MGFGGGTSILTTSNSVQVTSNTFLSDSYPSVGVMNIQCASANAAPASVSFLEFSQ
jgi:hypothetical protein